MPDKAMTPEEVERNGNLLRYLKSWLKHRNVTQRGLADHLGVSEGTVSKWLKGTQAMTLAQFQAIAALLGAEPHQLIYSPNQTEAADRGKMVVDSDDTPAWALAMEGRLHGGIAALDARLDRMDARLDRMDAHFDKIDAHFDKIDAHLDKIDAHLDRVDARLDKMDARLDRVDARLDRMDARLDRVDARLDTMEARLGGVEAELTRVRSDMGAGFERLNDRMTSFESPLSVTLAADAHVRRHLAARAEDHAYLLDQIVVLQQQIVRLEGRLAAVEHKAA